MYAGGRDDSCSQPHVRHNRVYIDETVLQLENMQFVQYDDALSCLYVGLSSKYVEHVTVDCQRKIDLEEWGVLVQCEDTGIKVPRVVPDAMWRSRKATSDSWGR